MSHEKFKWCKEHFFHGLNNPVHLAFFAMVLLKKADIVFWLVKEFESDIPTDIMPQIGAHSIRYTQFIRNANYPIRKFAGGPFDAMSKLWSQTHFGKLFWNTFMKKGGIQVYVYRLCNWLRLEERYNKKRFNLKSLLNPDHVLSNPRCVRVADLIKEEHIEVFKESGLWVFLESMGVVFIIDEPK
jgi:hypothetical protein